MKHHRAIVVALLAVFIVAIFVAAEAPEGFPTSEFLWIGALGLLGFLVPYLLGIIKYSTWNSRFLKTLVGYAISAVVAALAVVISRLATGKWPFNLDLAGLGSIGVAWVQFCYSAFVKTWLNKVEDKTGKHLLRHA